jgi:hypothetical protein
LCQQLDRKAEESASPKVNMEKFQMTYTLGVKKKNAETVESGKTACQRGSNGSVRISSKHVCRKRVRDRIDVKVPGRKITNELTFTRLKAKYRYM